MGAGSSKPEAAGDSKHVFSSNSPIQFSSNLVEALQSTSETDSSRTKAVELEIQNRVAAELKRLHEREKQTLAEIEKRISESKDTGAPAPITAATGPVAHSNGYPVGSLNLDAPRIPFAGREHDAPAFTAPVETSEQAPVISREISRDSVNSEIEKLRSRLDGRRKLVDIDESVEKAKNDVVGCLRLNDRRPLNCWKEVEAFKKEVAKMETAFVDRIVG
ncbi:uncharacterized protein N7484_001059 [Penicillium longicatenatum]|uniref:uncharacterized protein n=1 Tax=Penicillium longicatenatum TaxID=1561947 RepID=UPI00254882D2|nr:uncharacterized protein N7484_001059 [Penicillium longicatenatum]KAJ5657410.1 hypothetical protein N7484_001059 [Penicillium longicatenatum]